MTRYICIALMGIFLVLSAYNGISQVAINPDGLPPAPSAMLDVSSPDRGFLPPRLELVSADAAAPVNTPATGLLIYNTQVSGNGENAVVPGYYSWSGSRWLPVSPPVGINPGDMAYWNGTGWTIIPAGSYGQTLVFCNGVPRWGGCPPMVMTDTITGITPTGASCGGRITADGGSAVAARGVCWDTIAAPTVACGHTLDGSGTGSFQSTISGLIPNKTYYVRAYGINAFGVGYGDARTFVTSGSAPGLKP